MPSYKAREGVQLNAAALASLIEPHAAKYAWFLSKEYVPHYWQTLFHTMRDADQLCRFRHLVAGRRGGKTLSAAWELLYYLLHPAQFHLDAHGKDDDRPLLAWVLTLDYPAGWPALDTFRQVMKQAGLEPGLDYKEHKTNRWIEFNNGSFLAYKTADSPDSLRGAGLDWLWLDEAAMIPNREAYNVVRPALADKLGLVVGTTTPKGKNWYYDEFWNERALGRSDVGRVEYWSIDNPYFPAQEWRDQRLNYHPLLFKQEYCAAFDSMAGKELSGEWLKYYEASELPKRENLNFYMGVDPAISLADSADRFSIAVIAVTKNNEQAYLVDQYASRIPFAEQLEKIAEYAQMYHPQMISVEANAYQAALAQQAFRIPGLLPIFATPAKGKKADRILGMAPVFRLGRVKIRRDHVDFVNEWIDYDSELKNPKDDCLDAVEMALRAAGALLPGPAEEMPKFFAEGEEPAISLQDLAWKKRPRLENIDEFLGTDW
ncbi:MAG: terminase family protein [Patescibacteria group bacterium]|nr:terminase family protein [Patescibacteria group bacterium]